MIWLRKLKIFQYTYLLGRPGNMISSNKGSSAWKPDSRKKNKRYINTLMIVSVYKKHQICHRKSIKKHFIVSLYAQNISQYNTVKCDCKYFDFPKFLLVFPSKWPQILLSPQIIIWRNKRLARNISRYQYLTFVSFIILLWRIF